eukprot:scaffold274527_cov20-Tisochrysis_lutea.AAC.1
MCRLEVPPSPCVAISGMIGIAAAFGSDTAACSGSDKAAGFGSDKAATSSGSEGDVGACWDRGSLLTCCSSAATAATACPCRGNKEKSALATGCEHQCMDQSLHQAKKMQCGSSETQKVKAHRKRQTRRGCGSKGKEGQGFIAAPAYKGNLAKAKRWWRSSKSHRCGNRDSKRSKKKRGRTHTRMHNNDTLRSAHTCEVTMSIQEKDHQRGLEPRRMLMELIPRRS